MDVSIVALRSLIEVSRRGTMTAAAGVLGYTPGAISQHIASLSKAVGRPVVEQAGRGVKLTDTGRAVLAHARRVVDSEALLRDELDRQTAQVAGKLVIGAFGSSAALLEDAFTKSRLAYPQLTLHVWEIRETTTDNASLAVGRSDVDLAVSLDYRDAPTEQDEDLEYRRLMEERFGVVGLAPGEGSDPASLKDLALFDWLIPPPESNYGAAVRAACRRAGFEPRARHLVTDTAMSLRLAMAGLGITLATPLMLRFAAAEPRQWRALEESVTRDIVLLTRRDDHGRPAITAIANVIAEAAATANSVGKA